MNTTVASILIELPEAVVSGLLPQNDDLFEELGSRLFLALYCQPSEYKPITTELGDLGEDGLIVGYSSVLIAVAARLEGFELSSIEGRSEPVSVLRAVQAAVTSAGFYQPISVYDGHNLLSGHPIVEINGRQFAERQMKLTAITPTGGSLQRGLATFSSGFTVRLMDVAPRR